MHTWWPVIRSTFAGASFPSFSLPKTKKKIKLVTNKSLKWFVLLVAKMHLIWLAELNMRDFARRTLTSDRERPGEPTSEMKTKNCGILPDQNSKGTCTTRSCTASCVILVPLQTNSELYLKKKQGINLCTSNSNIRSSIFYFTEYKRTELHAEVNVRTCICAATSHVQHRKCRLTCKVIRVNGKASRFAASFGKEKFLYVLVPFVGVFDKSDTKPMYTLKANT